MGLAAVALGVGVVVGRLTGGRMHRLGRLRLAGWQLLAGAAIVQLVGAFAAADRTAQAVGVVGSALLVFAFLGLNRRTPGVLLIATGLLINVTVVLANGAMPVSTRAAHRAGVSLAAIGAGADPRHLVAHAGTPLRALADVVPLPLPLHPEVVSPGDVLIAGGLGVLVALAMRTPDRERLHDREARMRR